MSKLIWLSPVLLTLFAPPTTTIGPIAGANLTSDSVSQPNASQAHTNCTDDSLESSAVQMYVYLSPFWYTFMAVITAIGLFVSLISNMIIIYLFACTPSLRNNPSNIVAVNLSLSDLLYCIQWPSVIYCSVTQTTWMLESNFVCKSFGFITLSTALASIITVLVMSIERVLVISNPIKAKLRFTNRTAHLVTLMIWIVALSTAFPPLFGKFNRYTLDPSRTSCTLDYLSHRTHYKLYILVLYVLYWILPAIIITICYLMIIQAFKRSSLSLREASGCSTDTSTYLALQAANTCTGTAQLGKEAPPPPPTTTTTGKPKVRSPNALQCSTADDNDVESDEVKVVELARPWTHWSGFAMEPIRKCFGTFQSRGSIMRTEAGDISDGARDNNHNKPVKSPEDSESRRCTNDSVVAARLATSEVESDSGGVRERKLLAPVGSIWVRPSATDSTAKKVSSSAQIPSTYLCSGEVEQQRAPNSTEKCYLRRSRNDNSDDAGASKTRRQTKLAESVSSVPVRAERRRRRQANAPPQPPQPKQTEVSGPPQPPPYQTRDPPPQPGDERASSPEGRAVAASAAAAADDYDCNTVRATMTKTTGERRKSSLNMTNSVSWNCHLARRTSATSCVGVNLDLAADLDVSGGRRPNRTPSHRCNQRTCFRTGNSSGRALCSLATVDSAQPPLPPPQPSRLHCFERTSSTRRQLTHFRLAKMSFYLILLWLVSWTPIASLAMVNSVRECHHASVTAIFLAHTMTKLGPTFDVFIYGISHPKIKSKFRQIVKWMFTFGRFASIDFKSHTSSAFNARGSSLAGGDGGASHKTAPMMEQHRNEIEQSIIGQSLQRDRSLLFKLVGSLRRVARSKQARLQHCSNECDCEQQQQNDSAEQKAARLSLYSIDATTNESETSS